MMEALITGKLFGKAEQRTSRGGKAFVTAKVRVPSADDAVFIGVVAFADTVQAALLALDDGEAVALAGTLSAKAWTDRDGNARPSPDLIANQLLTVHHAKRKREAMRPRGEAASAGLDDGADAWPEGSGL